MAIEPADHRGMRPSGWSSRNVIRVLSGARGRPLAIVVAVLLALGYVKLGKQYWRPVQDYVFDTYQRISPRQVERFPAIIVAIDDASLNGLGQWPWPRSLLAKLIEKTHDLGALAIGLDILMPEADRLSPSVFIADRPEVSPELREALSKLPSNDAILAETLRRVPSVVGRAGNDESGEEVTPSGGQTPVSEEGGGTPVPYVTSYKGHVINVPLIEEAAWGRAYLNATPDPDGVVRLMPLLVAVQGTLAPTLALELLRVAMGENWHRVHTGPHGIRGVQIGPALYPTDLDGRIRLYFSPMQPQRRISALTIMNGEADADMVRNHVALIGVTSTGTHDVAATPVDARMDGVELHAQLIENMLAGNRLVRPVVAPWLEVLAFLVIAAALVALLPRLRPGHSVVAFLVLAAVLCIVSVAFFVRAHVLLDPSFPIVGNALILTLLLSAEFALVRRALEREKLERLRVAGELKAAGDIQMGILPLPGTIEGLPDNVEFHAFVEPAAEVGGDLYDAFMLDENHFFFLVGDVSGKGVPASLFMALSKVLCKSAALRQLASLDEVIILANQEISRENRADLFVTLVAGILDVRTGDMRLCSAGHDAPILLRAGEMPCTIEPAGGPPLCVLDDFPYDSSSVRLQPDDMLIMITDGVTEAHDPEKNLYGLERTLTYLAALPQDGNGRSTAAVCQGLYKDIKAFVQHAAPSDDVTIMAIRFTAPQLSMPPA